ncbi:alpha/beta fold hydrolase [Promicromonospora sp. NPDC057488]|uniref:alpha/beta fold hydrolase n=1 Tax=Promicromonospora sp. NPDC057488 TaxID=3346147 RepID=UPI00366FD0C8
MDTGREAARRTEDDLGITHTWGDGPEVVFLSNPLADPVAWSAATRGDLLRAGHRVTTFEHRPEQDDWCSVVACVTEFVERREAPVALVGWSQGAAVAQEVALAAPTRVRAAALLAPYGRQNQIDVILQQAWDDLLDHGTDSLRLLLNLLTAFPPERLADDGFVRHLRATQDDWSGPPDPQARRRSAGFIRSYQDRLSRLADVVVPCLVVGFELDTDTFAARAREVADAIPGAEYLELPGLGHAAPATDPHQVWPPVLSFLTRHHPVSASAA